MTDIEHSEGGRKPRKQVDLEAKRPRSLGRTLRSLPKGETKQGGIGRPLEGTEPQAPTGLWKRPPSRRRAATWNERQEWPMRKPNPVSGTNRDEATRSVRFVLRIEGERISVLDSTVVDAPPLVQSTVRGANFLEVSGPDGPLAMRALVDPGLDIAIPDPSSDGVENDHRVSRRTSYDLVIRVPLAAVEALDPASITIAVYEATEHLVINLAARESVTQRVGQEIVRTVAVIEGLRPEDLPREISQRGDRKQRDTAADD
ncbi:hypothetical protein [Agromyces mariniharenae]|uniref:Uncharacterized protein n=1 Tax=Agromyces mariniharenae TaxID=2604423 RepID=A0A5S4V080_9MICO|nr:hypothetical protein [Agromyces mariniharenae]TYL51163.1 hypothetical protein FYC51_18780 [Agromyces mariniharenae]